MIKLAVCKNKRFDTQPIAELFTVGEKNVDVIEISVPLKNGEKDITRLNFKLRGVSDERDTMVETSPEELTKAVTVDDISLVWTVSEKFTCVPGHINLSLIGFDEIGKEVYIANSSGYVVNAGSSGAYSPPRDILETTLIAVSKAAQAAEDSKVSAEQSAVSAAASAKEAAESASAAAQAKVDAVAAALRAKADASEAQGSAEAAEAFAKAAATVSEGYKGWYPNVTALRASIPDANGQVGWYAILGSTDSVWVWDAETVKWKDSHQDMQFELYYKKTESDARYATTAQGKKADDALSKTDAEKIYLQKESDASATTVVFEEAGELEKLASGLKLGVLLGTVSKAVSVLIAHLIDYNNPHKTPNRNLARNADFANPVNQRGVVTWSSGYGIDGWTIHNGSVSVGDGQLIVNSGILNQLIEKLDLTKTYTLTVFMYNGEIFIHTGKVQTQTETSFGYLGIDKVGTNLQILISCNKAARGIRAVLLEEGTVSTFFVPKGYGVELVECKRYFKRLPATTLTASGKGGTSVSCFINFEEMRDIPTIMISSIFKIGCGNSDTTLSGSISEVYEKSVRSYAFAINTATATVANQFYNGFVGYIDVSAEL